MKLLSPGPVTLTRRVREALLHADISHRELEFAALMAELRARLISVYPQSSADFVAMVMTGSGTSAVEAMIGSLVPLEQRALVIANGVYGERAAGMLTRQGKPTQLIKSDWTEPLNLAKAEEIMKTQGIKYVAAVHLETTTGRLNDIVALGALCKQYDAKLLLDCVSSFGGEEIDFENWNLEACAGTSYVCLHSVPGVSFVIARKSAFSKRETGAMSVYLDLFRYYAEQARNVSPFTPAIGVYFALNEALQELADGGGWRSRRAHYRDLTRELFDGLRRQGIEPLLDISEPSSSAIAAYRIPGGSDYSSLHDHLKEAGFVIYAGQGKLAGEMFRVATLGALSRKDIAKVLSSFEAYWSTRTRQPHQEIPTLALDSRKPK